MNPPQPAHRKPDVTANLAHLLFDPETYILSAIHSPTRHPDSTTGPSTQAGRLPNLKRVLEILSQQIQTESREQLAATMTQTDDFGLSSVKVLQYLIEEDKKFGLHLPHSNQLYHTLNLLWEKSQEPGIWLESLIPAIGRSTRKHGIFCPETDQLQQPNNATDQCGENDKPDPKLTLLIRLAGNPMYRKTLRDHSAPQKNSPTVKKETPTI